MTWFKVLLLFFNLMIGYHENQKSNYLHKNVFRSFEFTSNSVELVLRCLRCLLEVGEYLNNEVCNPIIYILSLIFDKPDDIFEHWITLLRVIMILDAYTWPIIWSIIFFMFKWEPSNISITIWILYCIFLQRLC